ncbi:fumarylacetoacetate hydrolase family protein [Rhizobium sp. 1AS11]|uniref:fumarylacetoacetate hydrolase family protein n=1 Tax=Rhizobium acaciae TaxID=2989736 RepID=UPI0022230C1E|nr:fumarylacetoacetate hydrolase family protein [Rhizobium acaciae]MCW1411311.1 fumarylacetoacetate hydrolase family protein [Rhizobium acaciae]MCW1743277.1 fumarylacetoacetate hydrolase family protein [Rhizobium acaciae]
MKIISFEVKGKEHYGVVEGDNVIDLSTRLGPDYLNILDFITKNPVAEVAALIKAGISDYALNDVRLLPVVPDAGKIICVGLNYEEHKKEGVRNPADKPMLFARWPETLIAHGDPMVIPKISDMLDFEAEMLVVIGKETGRYLPASEALDKVFGYSCMNEGSVRDWQRHSSQVTAGKNFVGTGPVGPWIVTADEIPDVQDLDLELRVNGETMQKANTRDMIWSVSDTIEYVTQWIPLHPGDLIATGTPAGVGSRRTPPVFLKDGDVVEVSISRIGTLQNRVTREKA